MQFTRGYQETKDRVARYPKYNRSCTNCDFYYQAVGDKTECCQNRSVLEYDMIVTETNVYCLHWQPCNKKSKNLFKQKTGRDRLE